MNTTKLVLENIKRREVPPYEPYTGEGAPLERELLEIEDFYLPRQLVPLAMLENPLVQAISRAGSIEAMSLALGEEYSQEVHEKIADALIKVRIIHDFFYWAASFGTIKNKEGSSNIPFVLNRPQRRLVEKLERMRLAGKPIRIIVLKARQWGGSTAIQIYMAWIQLVHLEGWYSAIIAQDNSSARRIQAMYSKLLKEYPPKLLGLPEAELEFGSYGKSANDSIIKQKGKAVRDTVISIGSVVSPDSIRSSDIALSHFCLAPGTLIPVKDGYLKKVEDVEVGDMVLTHTGNHTTIKAITASKPTDQNGSGLAITIHPWLAQPQTFTPNHPIWTKRGWVPAGALTKDDWLSMPIREITHIKKEVLLGKTPPRKQGGGRQSKGSGKSIPLTKETGFAFGYYLAEGSLGYSNNRASEITLSRHDKETSYGNRAIKALTPYFSSHFRKKREGTLTTHEHLYGVPLAMLMEEEFGAKENKTIPNWVFSAGRDFLEGLLEGYLSGDGSKHNDKQGEIRLAVISACTVSSSIAMQIRDIAASLNLGWAAIDIKEVGNHYGRNCKQKYTVRWTGQSARNIRHFMGQEYPNNGHSFSEKSIIEEGIVWFKIRKLTPATVDIVYDIEVTHSDHSFRTMYFSVKNSEVGVWKETEQWNASSIIRSVTGSILNRPMTMIAFESTANGTGNYFHTEWLRANKPDDHPEKSSMEPIFVPWYEIELYSLDFEDEAEMIAFADWLIDNRYNEKPSTYPDAGIYYWWLWGRGATLENIHWYVDKRRTYADHADMAAEYPSDDIEAFKHSGHKVFDLYKVEELRKSCFKPVFLGDISAESNQGFNALHNIKFVANENGNLKIWEYPDLSKNMDGRYLVVVDPQKGASKTADFSDIVVIDRYWRMFGGTDEIVAEWHGHIDKDLLAWKAAQISTMYDKALLVIERNTYDNDKGKTMDQGEFIIDTIAEHYDNMYVYVPMGRVIEKESPSIGFFTNKGTKPAIVNHLIALVRELGYVERNERALDELNVYELKDDGNWGAMKGKNDEHVIVRAIGLWISSTQMDPPSEKKAVRVRTKHITSERL